MPFSHRFCRSQLNLQRFSSSRKIYQLLSAFAFVVMDSPRFSPRSFEVSLRGARQVTFAPNPLVPAALIRHDGRYYFWWGLPPLPWQFSSHPVIPLFRFSFRSEIEISFTMTFVNVGTSLAGARTLWVTGGALGLNLIDRVKYALSWYLSRHHALLAKLAPTYFVVQLRCGMRMPIRPNGVDHKTLADIFVRCLYDLRAADVKRVLDLGANIGAATLFFAERFPEVEFGCVEPSPANRFVLRELIRLNRLRATVFEGAVGTDAGEVDLDVGCDPDTFSLTPAKPSSQHLRVRKFTVPELLATLGWSAVDVLKIDIEGYEKTLFRGNNAWLSRVRLIIGEAHGHVGYGISDVQADLAPFGFQVTQKDFDANNLLTIFEARNSSA
jgi:FkbM family methyltransferase